MVLIPVIRTVPKKGVSLVSKVRTEETGDSTLPAKTSRGEHDGRGQIGQDRMHLVIGGLEMDQEEL